MSTVDGVGLELCTGYSSTRMGVDPDRWECNIIDDENSPFLGLTLLNRTGLTIQDYSTRDLVTWINAPGVVYRVHGFNRTILHTLSHDAFDFGTALVIGYRPASPIVQHYAIVSIPSRKQLAVYEIWRSMMSADLLTTLDAPDGASTSFGVSISTTAWSEFIVAGDPGSGEKGKVYVFKKHVVGDPSPRWTSMTIDFPSAAPSTLTGFGYNVATNLKGRFLCVSAFDIESTDNAVLLFERKEGSSTFSYFQTLTSPISGLLFGFRIVMGLFEPYVIIGAPLPLDVAVANYSHPTLEGHGYAYSYNDATKQFVVRRDTTETTRESVMHGPTLGYRVAVGGYKERLSPVFWYHDLFLVASPTYELLENEYPDAIYYAWDVCPNAWITRGRSTCNPSHVGDIYDVYCPAGTYKVKFWGNECTPCPWGEYSGTIGRLDGCTRCPVDTGSREQGGTSENGTCEYMWMDVISNDGTAAVSTELLQTNVSSEALNITSCLHIMTLLEEQSNSRSGEAFLLRLTVDGVADYFSPRDDPAIVHNLCSVLTSGGDASVHSLDLRTWHLPVSNPHPRLGGSAINWALADRMAAANDTRQVIGSWGTPNGSEVGGCCGGGIDGNWGMPYKLEILKPGESSFFFFFFFVLFFLFFFFFSIFFSL